MKEAPPGTAHPDTPRATEPLAEKEDFLLRTSCSALLGRGRASQRNFGSTPRRRRRARPGHAVRALGQDRQSHPRPARASGAHELALRRSSAKRRRAWARRRRQDLPSPSALGHVACRSGFVRLLRGDTLLAPSSAKVDLDNSRELRYDRAHHRRPAHRRRLRASSPRLATSAATSINSSSRGPAEPPRPSLPATAVRRPASQSSTTPCSVRGAVDR